MHTDPPTIPIVSIILRRESHHTPYSRIQSTHMRITAAQIGFRPHEINFNELDILSATGGSLDFTLRAALRKITSSWASVTVSPCHPEH